MLEQPSFLLRPLGPSRLEVVSPDGGEVLGSARRVERTRFRWLAWLWPPEVAFHENGDEPLLFVMQRRRGAAPRWHVRDADDWTVGRIVGSRLLDRLDRPLALLRRLAGTNQSVYVDGEGRELSAVRPTPDGVLVELRPDGRNNPFVKMLLLAAALAHNEPAF